MLCNTAPQCLQAVVDTKESMHVNICVADDMPINTKVMKYMLSQVNSNWNVQLVADAEQVMSHLDGTQVLIIDNDFGPDKLLGSQAVQLIRQSEAHNDLIIALWSDDARDTVGADFMWPKKVSKETISTDLNHALSNPRI